MRLLLIMRVCGIVLAALCLNFNPAFAAGAGHHHDAATEMPNLPDGASVIRVDAAAGPAKTIVVKLNAPVYLEIATAEPTELHLHGYDLVQRSTNEKPALFVFTAKHTGRFAIVRHAHGTGDMLGRKEKPVAYVEVRR